MISHKNRKHMQLLHRRYSDNYFRINVGPMLKIKMWEFSEPLHYFLALYYYDSNSPRLMAGVQLNIYQTEL